MWCLRERPEKDQRENLELKTTTVEATIVLKQVNTGQTMSHTARKIIKIVSRSDCARVRINVRSCNGAMALYP